MFSNTSHSFFQKITLFINTKKYFSKLFFAFFLRSVFISIYCFSQAFWLNVITLWTFLKINPGFDFCFKFLICIIYSVLSLKLATSFSASSVFVLSGKMVNYQEIQVIFNNIEHQLWENILHHFLHYSFLMKSSLNWEVSLIYSKLFTGSFCDISQPYKLLHSNTEYMTNLYFDHNRLCTYH